MTRVVIEASDPECLTAEEQDMLVAKAREQIVQAAEEKLNGENIDEVRLDDECPYGTRPDEQKRILITADMERTEGTGYDSMLLLDRSVSADISEEDFLCELKKMMDVPWEQDGDYRYIAITDEKMNKTRLCHLLATLEY